jgi:hypothetical protein
MSLSEDRVLEPMVADVTNHYVRCLGCDDLFGTAREWVTHQYEGLGCPGWKHIAKDHPEQWATYVTASTAEARPR